MYYGIDTIVFSAPLLELKDREKFSLIPHTFTDKDDVNIYTNKFKRLKEWHKTGQSLSIFSGIFQKIYLRLVNGINFSITERNNQFFITVTASLPLSENKRHNFYPVKNYEIAIENILNSAWENGIIADWQRSYINRLDYFNNIKTDRKMDDFLLILSFLKMRRSRMKDFFRDGFLNGNRSRMFAFYDKKKAVTDIYKNVFYSELPEGNFFRAEYRTLNKNTTLKTYGIKSPFKIDNDELFFYYKEIMKNEFFNIENLHKIKNLKPGSNLINVITALYENKAAASKMYSNLRTLQADYEFFNCDADRLNEFYTLHFNRMYAYRKNKLLKENIYLFNYSNNKLLDTFDELKEKILCA